MLIAVTDLAAAAQELQARCGLASVQGGQHPDWGTANRIVPLGRSYLELVAVVDQQAAADSSFGRWVAGGASRLGRPLGWAVRTGQLDQLAGRLGLTVRAGARVAPTGEVLRWRSAGIDQAAAEPSLPFFIEWGAGVRLPGTAAVVHPAASAGISKLLLDGDPGRLAWQPRAPDRRARGSPRSRGHRPINRHGRDHPRRRAAMTAGKDTHETGRACGGRLGRQGFGGS